MPRKGSLHEFQARLASRLAEADERSTAGLLGFQAGNRHWLVRLADSGEIIPLPTLTTVPLTRPWFVGIAHIRGNLFSVSDFSAFQGREPTPQNSTARLLLIGTRHGNNAALLVTRTLGLRNLDNFTRRPGDADAPPWAGESFADHDGQQWTLLDVQALLADERFMDIGV